MAAITMNEIDNQYYKFISDIGRPFYDWERQIINLGCKVEDISLSKQSTDISKEGKIHSSKFIHEYIHYLQNFATAWGAPVFTDLSLALMKIGSSAAESKEEIELPLVMSNLKNTTLISGLTQRTDVINRINRGHFFKTKNDHDFNDININNITDDLVKLENGRVCTGLGLKVIREHMAYLGTQLFLGKSDDEIHNFNINLNGFKRDGISLSEQSEYWILFEYFYQIGKFNDVARGTLHLTQQSLITLNPNKAVARFFKWLNNKLDLFPDDISLIEIVEDWLKLNNEISFHQFGLTKSLEHCEGIIKLTEKHLGEHDMFLFVNKIANYSVQNISKTKGGRFLFNTTDQFDDLKFWKEKIVSFGTGTIRYLDATLMHGTEQHCSDMTDSFNFLSASSLVLKKILENKVAGCPFLDDIPICEASYKGEQNCYRNPFLVVSPEKDEKECLFRNGVLLMGMDERIKFE